MTEQLSLLPTEQTTQATRPKNPLPKNTLLHPDGLRYPGIEIVMHWTGKGRPPRWAQEWAKKRGIPTDRNSVKKALAGAKPRLENQNDR